MKRLKCQLFVVLAAMVLFCCCKKEEQMYSCDSTINEWVSKNKSSFQSISREQIGLLPMSLQKSVFRSLTPEKQWQLWVEKLNIVRSQWDVPVQKIVDLALNVMDDSWYNQPLSDDQLRFIKKIEDELLINLMDSIDYVINKCEWDISCLWSSSGCIKKGCHQTTTGCGFGFTKPCTGTCSRWMF